MVQLAPYLIADSVETYRVDAIDGDSVDAIFDPSELERGFAFRQHPAAVNQGLAPSYLTWSWIEPCAVDAAENT